MSGVIIDFNFRQAEKRAKELKVFLTELDGICDILYNRLQYKGVWETLMSLEEVRVQYVVEHYEQSKVTRFKRKETPNE